MKEKAWWQRGVIYQVYPRSFQDSNGDGVGDLKGISLRLEHLVDLGIDAIWISPIFPSPMRDFGYDVSDYCAIHPLFGSLADFDALLESAHARGLKVILDFVPNHTSDEHPWFQESRSSKFHPKRDWYVWRDAKPDGSPPNNWESEFGGPAWTFDEVAGQYYYHAYLKEQPDLNWRNPEVEQAMCDVLRFWFDRGVDGFRVDAIHHLHEDEEDRDNPPDPDWRPGMEPKRRWLQIRTIDQPGVHASIRAMRRVADAYPDRVMIGEAYLPIDQLMAYYGADLTGFHLPFNFHLISTDWKPKAVASLIETYEAALPVGRMAELGARQPRPISSCEPGWTRAGPGRRHASAYSERDADHLSGRGDWDGGHAHSAAPGAGPIGTQRPRLRPRARSRANADALEFRTTRRFYWRSTLASTQCGRRRAERLNPGQRSAIDVVALSGAHSSPPRQRRVVNRRLAAVGRDRARPRLRTRLGRQRVMVALNMTGQARSLKFRNRASRNPTFDISRRSSLIERRGDPPARGRRSSSSAPADVT